MNNSKLKKLEEYCKELSEFTNEHQIERWQAKVNIFLNESFGYEYANKFHDLGDVFFDTWAGSAKQCGYLEALISEMHTQEPKPSDPDVTNRNQSVINGKKIFIVHGHDDGVKEMVARYISQLGLEPIILHEQPNEGKTIIEKFVDYSDVVYAIVLMTPDDRGGTFQTSYKEQRPRARQNVIFELGYFIGKLGRSHVCALHSSGTEVLSDYSGVLYTPLDSQGTWRVKLAQELRAAGFAIDMNLAF